jgi:hypothetical protein
MGCFTHCATPMRFRQRALRASCGCALQIFLGAAADNILVIDIGGSKAMSASPTYSAND